MCYATQTHLRVNETILALERFIDDFSEIVLKVGDGNSFFATGPQRHSHITENNVFVSSFNKLRPPAKAVVSLLQNICHSPFVQECAKKAAEFTEKSKAVLHQLSHTPKSPMIPVIPTGNVSTPTSRLVGRGRRKPAEVYIEYMLHDRPLVYQDRDRAQAVPVVETVLAENQYEFEHELKLDEFSLILNAACKSERRNRQ